MSAREQLLKKRVESLEGQIKASLELLGRVLEESEYLTSVACAFAWDLTGHAKSLRASAEHIASDSTYNGVIDTLDDLEDEAARRWASAVEEASK